MVLWSVLHSNTPTTLVVELRHLVSKSLPLVPPSLIITRSTIPPHFHSFTIRILGSSTTTILSSYANFSSILQVIFPLSFSPCHFPLHFPLVIFPLLVETSLVPQVSLLSFLFAFSTSSHAYSFYPIWLNSRFNGNKIKTPKIWLCTLFLIKGIFRCIPSSSRVHWIRVKIRHLPRRRAGKLPIYTEYWSKKDENGVNLPLFLHLLDQWIFPLPRVCESRPIHVKTFGTGWKLKMHASSFIGDRRNWTHSVILPSPVPLLPSSTPRITLFNSITSRQAWEK